MTEYSAGDYARANQINANLAIRRDNALIAEGKSLAERMIEHVRSKTEDFDDFVKRVNLAEAYALTESRQVSKEEAPLKQIYLRAATLLDTIREAEARRG